MAPASGISASDGGGEVSGGGGRAADTDTHSHVNDTEGSGGGECEDIPINADDTCTNNDLDAGSEGEEKKEEETDAAADNDDDSDDDETSTSGAGTAKNGDDTSDETDDDNSKKRSTAAGRKKDGSHDTRNDEHMHKTEIDDNAYDDQVCEEKNITRIEDSDDSRKAESLAVDDSRKALALQVALEEGAQQAAAVGYQNTHNNAEDTDDSSRGIGSRTAASSAAAAMRNNTTCSSSSDSRAGSGNNNDTAQSAGSGFPRGLGPGAYHVIPLNSDAIQLPALNGFDGSSRRSSFTNGSRQSSFDADLQEAQRRSSLASIESMTGAHAIPAIHSRRSSLDSGLASDQQPSINATAGSGSRSGSGAGGTGAGSTEIDITTTAYLVEDRDALEDLPSAEVVDPDEFKGPEPKPFHRRREGRITLAVVGLLLLAVAVLVGAFYSNNSSEGSQLAAEVPTASPTQAPTFDPRPTLQVVQDRGIVRCGVENEAAGEVRFGRYTADLCRRLAAAIFGDPSRIQLVPIDDNDRYGRLSNREVDVMIAGDSFTVEKLVREPKTGSRIAFGGPYYGAAVVYAGLPTYVQCANNQKRHKECADLSICAVETPEISTLITSFFPASFVTFGLFPAMEASLRSGACNVIVSDTYRLSGSSLQADIDSGKYVISDYHISRNLISGVVRLGDSEWYDIVEGTRLTSIRSSQMGIYQDVAKCPANSSSADTPDYSDVSFYNATMCVGNSIETFQRSLGDTVLSWGAYLPAIDAPNFGSLECDDCANVLEWGKLRTISDRGHLNCAVYLDPAYNLTHTSLATLVNVKFCELLAVVIFQGNAEAINITYLNEMDYSTFPREFDVVAGATFDNKVGWDITNAGSMAFGMPYFINDKYMHDGAVYDGVGKGMQHAFDNEDVTLIFLSLAVVVATVYAQRQGITRATSPNMPQIHLFGEGLTFMLQDAVAYGGNYDEILSEALATSDGATAVGWNTVIPNYFVSPKSPVLYCDYTGNCPPCTWVEVDGNYICYSVGPF